jgi:hypothetical protein
MRVFVAVVICVAVAGTPIAAARATTPLQQASRASGLPIRHAVRTVVESRTRFDVHVENALDRAYPPALQRLDDELYFALGLAPVDRTVRSTLRSHVPSVRAQYDPASRVLRVRRTPRPKRGDLVNELVRALVDQHFNLRRLAPLRVHDRDASFAAAGTIDGLASLASGQRTSEQPRSPFDRFLATERDGAMVAGRTLLTQLREIGGRPAVTSVLRTWPQTTEQLLHVDKLLQREPALPVQLPSRAGDLGFEMSETFGELDVRALLGAFGLSNANSVADGWGGGRIALYRGPAPDATVAVVLRWDAEEDADEWRAIAPHYVEAAFPTLTPRACPAVDACWLEGIREVALASKGTKTVLVSGPNAELLAALLTQNSPSSRR